MKAFVTGGTGLLGNNLIRLLLQQGHEVKALARSREKAQRILSGLPVEIIIGDLRDINGLADALSGCEILFHTAAHFTEAVTRPGNHWEQLERTNITQTLALFAAAEKQGVRRIIHTSSNGAIGKAPGGGVSNEDTPPNGMALEYPYFRSKVQGNRAIMEFSRSCAVPIITVLPGWIFGPGDASLTGAARFTLDFLNGALPGVLDAGTDVVDVRDVASGMLAAAERGRSGERYIIAGRYVSQRELLATLEKITGIAAPTMPIPFALAFCVAWIRERISAVTGRENVLTVDGLKVMREGKRTSSEKAMRELGVTFRPLEETLRDTVAWLAQNERERIRQRALHKFQTA